MAHPLGFAEQAFWLVAPGAEYGYWFEHLRENQTTLSCPVNAVNVTVDNLYCLVGPVPTKIIYRSVYNRKEKVQSRLTLYQPAAQ